MNTIAAATSPGPVDGSRLVPPELQRSHLLPITVALSVVAHCGLLLVKFVTPDWKTLETVNTPMEVVLVNSKSARKPTRADALAQANLDGGGNTSAARRAKSNLPVLDDSSATDQVSLATRRVEQLEAEVRRLLTQARSRETVESLPQTRARLAEGSDGRVPLETMQRKLAIARMEAEIAREWEQYQKLPRRKFIGARTEEVVYAQYVDDWRQRIERVGTHNFPEDARRQGQYGTLLITVSIRADGSVERIDIDRSSGYPILDRAARRIAQLASPFPPFPATIRKQYDILSITRSWAFTRTDELVTE